MIRFLDGICKPQFERPDDELFDLLRLDAEPCIKPKSICVESAGKRSGAKPCLVLYTYALCLHLGPAYGSLISVGSVGSGSGTILKSGESGDYSVSSISEAQDQANENQLGARHMEYCRSDQSLR